jgi:hypothetical protein
MCGVQVGQQRLLCDDMAWRRHYVPSPVRHHVAKLCSWPWHGVGVLETFIQKNWFFFLFISMLSFLFY